MMLPDPVGWILYLNLALSFSSGVVIGATEIISTFQYRKKLLKTLSFWGLILLYGFFGLIAFSILALQNPTYWNKPLAALLSGLAPHVILRTRFTLLRSREEKGARKLDVSLDLDRIFNIWVKFIKDRIDVGSAQERRQIIDKLIAAYPSTLLMRNEVIKILYTLEAMDDEERKRRIEDVNQLYQDARDLHDEICLHRMADMALQHSDFDALDNRLALQAISESEESPVKAGAIDQIGEFIKKHPDLMDKINDWKARLAAEDWQYLNRNILQNPAITNKPRVAVRFLIKKGKIP